MKTRFLFLLLSALLFSPALAQDIYNPSCSGPWTPYTATATAQTPGGTPPTLTVTKASYKLCGNKTVLVGATVVVAAQGTGAGALRVTLPFQAVNTANSAFNGSSVEISLTGIGGTALITTGGAFVAAGPASGVPATFIVTGQTVVIGPVTYEIP